MYVRARTSQARSMKYLTVWVQGPHKFSGGGGGGGGGLMLSRALWALFLSILLHKIDWFPPPPPQF